MRITGESDLEWTEFEHGEARFRRKQLGEAAGGERLGCSLYEMPPGKHGWPYHYHNGNEEALYVLAGEGTLRTPEGEQSVEAGDYAAFPADERGGHALRNDGEDTLRFLIVSTMDTPDVTVYPDADAFGVYTGSPPGGSDERPVSGYFPNEEGLDYWTEVAEEDDE
ncbi:cupin [Halobacteriales archaeon QS_8_69_26]|nr:MAG: cupin [Halobacteriales archaeon QS_8_69_26]